MACWGGHLHQEESEGQDGKALLTRRTDRWMMPKASDAEHLLVNLGESILGEMPMQRRKTQANTQQRQRKYKSTITGNKCLPSASHMVQVVHGKVWTPRNRRRSVEKLLPVLPGPFPASSMATQDKCGQGSFWEALPDREG